jgi:hypothetical protein
MRNEADRPSTWLLRVIRLEPGCRSSELSSPSRTLNTYSGPWYCLESYIRDACLASDTRCILPRLDSIQCLFDLDNCLQVAFQVTDCHLSISTSRRQADYVVWFGVPRRFLPPSLDAILIVLQLGNQPFPEVVKSACALGLLCAHFSFPHCPGFIRLLNQAVLRALAR